MRIPTRTAVLFLGAALLAMSTTYGIASSQSGSGKYDTDGDGLIEVEFLEQLDAIRHDLDGDGITEGAAEDEYAAAYPVSVEEVVCNNCYGYELARPLDFAAADSYASGAVSTDWTAGGGWRPIGGGRRPFAATFNGNGHAVSSLFITHAARAERSDGGLFGSVGESGVIRETGLLNVNVTGGDFVGPLAGSNNGTVSHSHATGSVSGYGCVGGLVGSNDFGVISSSYAATNVLGGRKYLGGLAGCNNRGTIIASYATGSVSGNTRLGGLVGENSGSVIASYATGGVSGDIEVGGLAGNNSGSVIAGYATGGVRGQKYVGGLVGNNYNGSISAAYSVGEVTGGHYIGGLAGGNGGRVDYSYAVGKVSSDGSIDEPLRYIGGLVGYNPGIVDSGLWDTETSGQQVGIGIEIGEGRSSDLFGKTTAELQSPAGYTGPYQGWDVSLGFGGTENTPDYSLSDFLDFGTPGQYPALKVDFDGDGTPTWQEFGSQGRTAPPAEDNCVEMVAADGVISGAWSSACLSFNRPGSHARFYVFTLDTDSDVVITLESGDTNTYLYMQRGAGRTGRSFRSQGSQDRYSRIEDGFAAGTYTIEAATYEAGQSGSFTLTISGLATPHPLIAKFDTSGNGMIERNEVIAAINGYLFGEGDQAISKAEVIKLINLYLSAPSTPHNRPGAPEGLTAAGNGQTRMDLAWSAPPSDGGAAITGYRIEVSENGSTWTGLAANTRNAATSYSHFGLTAGTTRHYRVSAINSAGTGPASNIATGTTAGDAATNRDALAALYNATGGANWRNNGNWLSNAPMGEWHGVTTDRDGRVTQLVLSHNQLTGEIPAELGNLSYLRELYLSENHIVGRIPEELGNLANLEILHLNYNQLSGELPANLGSLSNLNVAWLWGNQLSGPIPPEYGSLSNLAMLRLEQNELTGSLPAALGGMSRLRILQLDENALSGEIPPELSRLTKLEWLGLGRNQIGGTIPAEVGDLANLRHLGLASNQITGEIPRELGQLTKLEELYLSDNQLTGEIPSTLGGLYRLGTLFLQDNQMTGSIPPELGNLSRVTHMNLSNNHLTGNIPPELGGLSSMWELHLSHNQLTGNIPPELGSLSKLFHLYLLDNHLTGEIPPELGNLKEVFYVDLSENRLSGEVPSELGKMTNLRRLNLQRNGLTGQIPAELGDPDFIDHLFLAGNQFSGCLPTNLVEIQQNDFQRLGLPRCDS